MPGDDELLAAAARRHRAPEPRATARRRTAATASSCFHRRRVWNEGEGDVDGVGAQARQAARAQSPAARRDRHELSSPVGGDRRRLPAGVRYVITLDADTRLPRGAARALVGTMAHPLNRPRFDPARGPRRRGLRRAAAARHADAADGRRGLAVPARLLGPARHRSVRLGGLRRLSGSVRRGLVHRQGHLRRRRLRGGARGPRARRTRCSATTCSRASSRAPGWSPTSRSSRSFPSRYDVAAARQHRWARGDWQLLPWIFGRATRRPAAPISADRPLEDARQPAPHAVGAGRLPRAASPAGRCRVGSPRDLDRRSCSRPSRSPPCCPCSPGLVPRRRGHLEAQPRARASAPISCSPLSQIALTGHAARRTRRG